MDHVRKSAVVKRSVVIRGRRTSVSLEDAFWGSLREIADRETTSVSNLVEKIDRGSTGVNLSSEIRVYVLNYFRALETPTLEPIDSREVTHAETNRY